MKTLLPYIIVALLASLGLNVLLFDNWQDAREEVKQASAAAKSCSDSVAALRTASEKQAEQAQADIDAAMLRAKDAEARATYELRRKPAVPGNACASAQVETREWLERRRSEK